MAEIPLEEASKKIVMVNKATGKLDRCSRVQWNMANSAISRAQSHNLAS